MLILDHIFHPLRLRRRQKMLDQVQNLLAKEESWTQCSMAKTSYETSVSPSHPEAVKFCMLGAIAKCDDRYNNLHPSLAASDAEGAIIEAALRAHYIFKDHEVLPGVACINDSPFTTHEVVVDLLAKAKRMPL